MARKFLTPIDLGKLEIQNARVQNLAAAPSSPVAGQIYYDTVANRLYYYNGSGWIAADGSSVSYGATATTSAVGDTQAPGSATTVSRSDHLHGREAFAAPAASAVGDVQTAGVATTIPRSDHKHAREAFAAPTAQTAFGAASATGTATTVPHSDHTHGTPTHVNADHSAINRSALAVPTADVPWGSFKITGLADPVAAQDAATKNYVDSVATGLDPKASVRVASTANVVVTYTATGGTSARGQITAAPNALDGVTLVAGNRLLLKNQTTGAQNGIYVVTTLGTGANGVWDRATDFDQDAEVTGGAYVWVEEGTINGDTGWVLTTNNPITIGGASGTALTWAQFAGAGTYTAGNGLSLTGTSFAVVPGNGIIADGTSTRVDPAVVTRKYATSVGDGAATSYVVTHNLGTQDVMVMLRDNASPFAIMEADFQATTVNTVTVVFAVAPTTNQYRVIVFG